MKFKEVTEIVSRDETTSRTTEYREESSFKDLTKSVMKQYIDFVDACPEYEIDSISLDASGHFIYICINNTKDVDKDEHIEVEITPKDQW